MHFCVTHRLELFKPGVLASQKEVRSYMCHKGRRLTSGWSYTTRRLNYINHSFDCTRDVAGALWPKREVRNAVRILGGDEKGKSAQTLYLLQTVKHE